MNRIQFLIVTSAAGLLVVLLFAQVLLARQAGFEQSRLAAVQQFLAQARGFEGNLKQVAVRVYQLSNQTQDQGLKDLLVRQQITFTANPNADGSTPPVAAPADGSTTH